MFFENKETLKIDDFFFEIPNSCKVDMVNCKDKMCDIRTYFENQWEFKNESNYLQHKKDIIKALKAFELHYNKHIKTTYKEMSAIHTKAMSPLTSLLESNLKFHQLENMIKAGKDVPDFRFEALETEYSKFLTGILEILAKYGEPVPL